MKTCLAFAASLLLTMMVASPVKAQGSFKVEKGQAFNKIVPRNFVLEENAIPVEKRNSVLVITPSGARIVAGLLDTGGYTSQIQEKYFGMLVSEGNVEVGGHRIAIGSYGFGLVKAPGNSQGKAAKFILYNQAGHRVAECTAKWDSKLRTPRPLQVVAAGGTARLYIGRNWVELKQ